MIDVSVIIVTRNTCAFTCAAVRSVLTGGDCLKTEIFVVDNGSTDETPAVLPREFPAVHYQRFEQNLGFGRANNAGARTAEGEFILLLNSDARLQPGALQLAVDYLRAHPECGLAGAQLLNPDGTRQNSIANFPTLATELLNKSLLRRLFPRRFPGKEQDYAGPVAVETVVGAFMLIRRAAWQAVGGFDEGYFFFFEETDLCREIHRRHWTVMHLPQVRVWHEQGQSARIMPAAARIEYWRSRYCYFRKHYGPLVRYLLTTGLLFRLAVDWLAGALTAALSRSPRARARWQVQTALWRWHFAGRPESMGLPR